MIAAPGGAPASNDQLRVFTGTSESVAVTVNASVTISLTVLLPGLVTVGVAFTSFTVTVITSKSLSVGVPLSVARIVMGSVPGPWASVGVQEKAPVEALIAAPAGNPASRENVSVLAGRSGSAAVAVNASASSSLTVLFPGFVTVGDEFTSFTLTVIASKSLSVGVPLSVARIVMGNDPGPCASVGVHEKTPVVLPIVEPVGAPASREKVTVFAGTSASVAVAVNASADPSLTVLFPIAVSVGATFTSFTVAVIASKSDIAGVPLSVARIVMGKLPGPCASVGVQEKAPVRALIVAPDGAPASSDHAMASAGRSPSVAVAVKVRAASSLTVLFPIAVSVGATFTSFTVTVIASKSLSAGVPLSVARIVMGNVPGPCASVGVQEKAPVEGLIVAPAGAPSSDQVRVLAGASASVAATVKVRDVNSLTVWLPGFVTTGATFTSLTVTAIPSKSLSAGVPLSVARMVMG